MHWKEVCSNCGHDLPEKTQFCAHCGQKIGPSRYTFGQFLSELASNMFALDNRLWRTLRILRSPGQLTEAYFAGKRESYIPPFRLFFFTILIHLAIINYFHTSTWLDQSDTGKEAGNELVTLSQNLEYAVQWRETLPEENLMSMALDTLIGHLDSIYQHKKKDTIIRLNIPYVIPKTVALTLYDLEIAHPDTLCAQHEITPLAGKVFINQLIKAYRHPKNFGNFIVARLSWIIFLLVPTSALVLFLLYWRRPYYYMEHLVFSMHFHVIVFMSISMGILLDWALDLTITPWLFLFSLGYTYFSMYNFYKQGMIKTFFKFAALHVAYLWLALAASILLLTISFLLFQ